MRPATPPPAPPLKRPDPDVATLRDEFAKAALTGMLARPVRRTFENAAAAYRYADAMLEVRNANR